MPLPRPRVTLIVPHRNQRAFLPERFDSIVAQTLGEWEALVIDGESDDGSWDYIRQRAADDPRIRAWQEPPRGPYAAWNAGLREARGEFIGIATADDTMRPDFLEKMTAALERHPGCGIAACHLEIIDGKGRPVDGPGSWREQPVPKFYLGARLDAEHERPAPHDGILHAATGTVQTSMTQLLARREVFSRAGEFREELGPGADFEWGMRASLLFSTAQVPEALATWRRHPAQATSDGRNATPASRRELAAMIETAAAAAIRTEPALAERIDGRRLSRPLRHQAWLFEREEQGASLPLLFSQWRREPDLIGLDLRNRWGWKGRYHRCHLDFIRGEMRRAGVEPFPRP